MREIIVIYDNLDEPGGIMPSEISQTKTNTAWSHLYVDSEKRKKKVKIIETENWRVGEIGREVGKKVQSLSYKKNKV